MSLALLFTLDRLLKFTTVIHFFRRPAPPQPCEWPSVTILSPITRGVSNLPNALACRGQLVYPGTVQHLLICDERDEESQRFCLMWQAAHPTLEGKLILVPAGENAIATKIKKLNTALPHAGGDVLCFVDDDVALRSDTLTTLIPYLFVDGVGAAFGVACYTAWHNLPTSLMSAFVNSNALLSYIPITYLTEPFTITGHCYAVRRALFETVGGLSGMAARLDDDHELARRLRRVELRSVQTPLVYDVENHFNSLGEYAKQMKRWFVFPRWMMVPQMTRWEQLATTISSLHLLLLPLLTLLMLLTRRATGWRVWGGALVLLNAVQWFCEAWYLQRHMPWYRWPLLTISALIAPLHIGAALLGNGDVVWRGQRLRLHSGGDFTVLGED